MKKVLLTVATAISIIGCQQSIEPQEKDKIIDISSLPEVSQMFVPLGQSAWSIMESSESRKLVYKEIDGQFDGDFNVLFSTLLNESTNGRSVESELNTKITNTLASFKSHEETKYLHPQIYIPAFEELKNSGLLGIQTPIIIFNDGPPTEDGLYQGYAYNNNKLVSVGMISENYASKNEVWVVGINERVDDKGRVITSNNTVNTNSKLFSYYNPSVKSIQIYGKNCMKEDWVSGAAEVSMTKRYVFNAWDTSDYETFIDDAWGSGNFERDHIKSVSRKAAKDKDVFTFSDNYIKLVGSWLEPTSTYYQYQTAEAVVFEWDAWPAGSNTAGTHGIQFRSYETKWMLISFSQGNNAYWQDTNCFNFKVQ